MLSPKAKHNIRPSNSWRLVVVLNKVPYVLTTEPPKSRKILSYLDNIRYTLVQTRLGLWWFCSWDIWTNCSQISSARSAHSPFLLVTPQTLDFPKFKTEQKQLMSVGSAIDHSKRLNRVWQFKIWGLQEVRQVLVVLVGQVPLDLHSVPVTQTANQRTLSTSQSPMVPPSSEAPHKHKSRSSGSYFIPSSPPPLSRLNLGGMPVYPWPLYPLEM